MSTLIAEHLGKTYKNRYVVKDINLKLQSGEIVGLLGPNGAGKTTIFLMLMGLISHDIGRIIVDEKDISILPLYARARHGIGYLPQESSIFRGLSVYDNLMAVLQIRKDITKNQRYSRANELMEQFNIMHLSYNLGQTLSGGERRRVEIARALASNPKFILLDEPFAGIDPISIIDIKRNIEQLSENNIGVLITDHNVREALNICEHSYIMSEGSIIAHGSPDEILLNELVKHVYLGKEFRL